MVATMLDPRFKLECFKSDKLASARDLLLKTVTEFHAATINADESQLEEQPPAKVAKKSGLGHLFEKMGHGKQQSNAPESSSMSAISNVNLTFENLN